MTNVRKVAQAFIEADEAYKRAEKALAEAKANVKTAFAQAGITTEIVDDKKVSIIERPVPKFDTEKLASLVSARIYKQVTKPTIDKDKFQSAVTLGLITPEVLSAVDQSTKSVFPQVFDLNKPAKKAQSVDEQADLNKVVSL